MKKLLLIATIAMLGLSIHAQNSSDSKKLLKKFSASEISSMDTETLKFNTHCINNAFTIEDLPTSKSNDSEISGTIVLNDLQNVNFFDLNIDLLDEKYQYFKIANTGKLLVVKPASIIKNEIK